MIIAKKGSIYIAARVTANGPKNWDENTRTSTLLRQAMLMPLANWSSRVCLWRRRVPMVM
jgi:hypothetical protein